MGEGWRKQLIEGLEDPLLLRFRQDLQEFIEVCNPLFFMEFFQNRRPPLEQSIDLPRSMGRDTLLYGNLLLQKIAVHLPREFEFVTYRVPAEHLDKGEGASGRVIAYNLINAQDPSSDLPAAEPYLALDEHYIKVVYIGPRNVDRASTDTLDNLLH